MERNSSVLWYDKVFLLTGLIEMINQIILFLVYIYTIYTYVSVCICV